MLITVSASGAAGKEIKGKRPLFSKMDNPEVTKLYKYRAFNEYSLSMLINREMWVPKPGSFNDPFDCSLMPGEAKTSEDSMHQLFQIIDELYDGEEAEAHKRKDMEENVGKDIVQVVDEHMISHFKEAEDSGVFSLSERCDSILMWSHYADNHQGFCIEFERSDSNILSHFMCRPVQYVDKYPNLNRVLDLKDVNLFTKALDWKYEAEWRLVTKEGNQTFPLPVPITGIIFGMKALDSTIYSIQNALKGQGIDFYKAERKAGEFAVDINKI